MDQLIDLTNIIFQHNYEQLQAEHIIKSVR